MHRIIILLTLCLSLLHVKGQHQFRRVTSLPAELNELSGIQYLKGQILAHNDGGNPAELFGIDTFGNILWKKKILADNVDWEDIAMKPDSFVFVADFGNNDNTRKDLNIYKVALAGFHKDTLDAEIISFSYSDQTAFPPSASGLNYDCEALIYFNDSLHLFTKNRTSPFDGMVRHYRIPAFAGNHVAILQESFQIGSLIKELYWITGADISPNGKKLALQSSDKVFMFSNFSGSDFLKGHVETFILGDISQKEAITFLNDSMMFIGDEANINPAGLYLLSLPAAAVIGVGELDIKQLKFTYDQSREILKFKTEKDGQLCVYDQSGRLIVRQPLFSSTEAVVNTKDWSSGAYQCVFSTKNEKFQGVFLKF
jgi:WD40 repeat protein